MEAFISEIVDSNFDEVVKLRPNAAKSAATRLKNELVEELESFLEDDNYFGRSRTLEAIEKSLSAAYNNYERAKYNNGELEENFSFDYHSRIAVHRSRFAFYQYLKTTIFADKPTKAPKPLPHTFDPELLEVVKAALEAKELLDSEGNFKVEGKRDHWKVRALYDALNKRNHIPDIAYKEGAFSKFFNTHFGFYISSTSIRTSPIDDENIDKEKALKLKFLGSIPEK